MKLRLSLYPFVVVVAALLAPSALAQKPVKEPVVLEPIEFAAGEVCPFAVRLEAIGNKQQMKTFPSGRVMITGRLITRVTNLATNRSMVVNTSGPVTMTELENDRIRIVGRGRNIVFSFERDVTGAALLLTTGRGVSILDLATDTVVSYQHQGRAIDLCARLAA